MQHYLQHIGLTSYVSNPDLYNNNSIVHSCFEKDVPTFKKEDIDSLYTYKVPQLVPGGSCSASKEPEPEPFNLATVYGLKYSMSVLRNHHATERLWHLNIAIEALQKNTGVDWLGIYRKVQKEDGSFVLLKEAYYGAFSRAEFPLTEEFAKGSNNSTVGLTGKAVLVQDVTAYAGPYYQCDAQVQSELCVPILTPENNVAGIIDAESFTPNFFSSQKIFDIVQVCRDLGREQEFLFLSV